MTLRQNLTTFAGAGKVPFWVFEQELGEREPRLLADFLAGKAVDTADD